MTETKRLIDLLKKADEYTSNRGITDYDGAISDNAEYLISNGVKVPLCVVGDAVYIIEKDSPRSKPYVIEGVVTAIGYDIAGFWITMALPQRMKQSAYVDGESIGKSIFLSEKDAKKAIKEKNRNGQNKL